MEIKEFSDLTNFIYDEYAKMSENLGTQQPSTNFVQYVERTLEKYIKLYDQPLYRQAKRDNEFQEALNTRPHCWLWKVFHSRMWQKIKDYEREEALIHKSEQEDVVSNNNSYSSETTTAIVPSYMEILSKDDMNNTS